jgi:hypothetical protein
MEPWRDLGVVYTYMEGAETMHRILWTGVLAAWLAACAAPMNAAEPLPPRPAAGTVTSPATGRAPPQRIPDVASNTPEPTGEPVGIATLPKELRRAVVADAARRFQVLASAVVLTRAEQVTWSDGSLGCPEAGRMYTQALVPGYRLVAKTPQGDLEYHADSRGNITSCATAPAPPREAFKIPKPVEPVTGPAVPAPER